jgi:hypothetical protein
MGGIATYEMTKTTCITRPKILSIQITHVRLAYSQRQGFDSVITLARRHLLPPPQSTCPPIEPAIDTLSGYLEPAFYLEPRHRVIGRGHENSVADMTASSLASQPLQGRRLIFLVVNRPVKDPDAAHRAVE